MQISMTRYLNENLEVVGGFIERDEWIQYIEDSALVSPDSPRTGKNPLTGTEIKIAPQPDIGWLLLGDERISLQYNDGSVWAECDPSEHAKAVIARVARELGATIIDQNGRAVEW